MITSIKPKLDFSEIDKGIFYIYVGYHGIPVNVDEFKQQVADIIKGRGTHDFNPEHIIRNLAIFVAMNGTDVSKLAALKTAVEGTEFKI